MAQATMVCWNHRRRETRVACCSCGKPICERCMRESAVGMKCPDCARPARWAGPRLGRLAAAAGAGLGAAVAVGYISGSVGIPLASFIGPLLAGIAIGEVVGRVGRSAYTRPLAATAGISGLVGIPLGLVAAGVPAGGLLALPALVGIGLCSGLAAWWASRR